MLAQWSSTTDGSGTPWGLVEVMGFAGPHPYIKELIEDVEDVLSTSRFYIQYLQKG